MCEIRFLSHREQAFWHWGIFAFQRRPVTASSDLCTQDGTDCMFPDLVSCTVPVEQILPSILTMSWSRGMGHLVRAQNIHTIGNLSALKEEQVTRSDVIFVDFICLRPMLQIKKKSGFSLKNCVYSLRNCFQSGVKDSFWPSMQDIFFLLF